MIRVLLADDQSLVRAGVRALLDSEQDSGVVGEAADGQQALELSAATAPDVVLMDIRMPELDGLGAAEQILADPELDTAVLLLTTFDRDEYVYEALRIGASGFLLKDVEPADLLADVGAALARVVERELEQVGQPAPVAPLAEVLRVAGERLLVHRIDAERAVQQLGGVVDHLDRLGGLLRPDRVTCTARLLTHSLILCRCVGHRITRTACLPAADASAVSSHGRRRARGPGRAAASAPRRAWSGPPPPPGPHGPNTAA